MEEMNRYREPFLAPQSRKPSWCWPNEIPIAGEPADVTAAVGDYNGWIQNSDLPKLLLHATPGAVITAPLVARFWNNVKQLKVVNIGEGTLSCSLSISWRVKRPLPISCAALNFGRTATKSGVSAGEMLLGFS